MGSLYENIIGNAGIYHIDYKEYRHRIQWLYIGRIFTAIPCFVIYILVSHLCNFRPNIVWLAVIVAFEVIVNAPYDFIIKKIYHASKENILVLIMLGLDVIAVTFALHFVGLHDAFFFGAMYLVTISFAGILTSKRITYIIATFAAVCYGGLTLLEYSGIIQHIPTVGIILNGPESAGWAVSHILFFYIFAYLSNFYSNPLKIKEKELYVWGKKLEKRLRQSHIKTIRALLNALKIKDPYTELHSSNVAWYSTLIAREMNLSRDMIYDIRDACLLHDIGKIGIQDAILNKCTQLTSEEWDKIKHHPEFGSEIVAALGDSEKVSKMIIQEHERFDGQGYPQGISGDEICLGAQIIAVADAFDVMVTGRCYKNAMEPGKAVDIIKENQGKQFSPNVVNSFCRVYADNENDILMFIQRNKVKLQNKI